jgi:hypothetical protein
MTTRSDPMKYLLLIYQNPANWDAIPQGEREEIYQEVDAIMRELAESGEWVSGEGLAHPSQSRAVRVRGGMPAVTDGPFLEVKEQLAGLCVLECESIDRAVEIAARWPDARYWGVEVRPVMASAGSDLEWASPKAG